MNTLHTPLPKTRWRRFFISLWGFFSWFKQQHVRYAIKASAAAVILATPAFLPSTGERFRELRMEWALVTVSIWIRGVRYTKELIYKLNVFIKVDGGDDSHRRRYKFGCDISYLLDHAWLLRRIRLLHTIPCQYLRTTCADLALFNTQLLDYLESQAWKVRAIHLISIQPGYAQQVQLQGQ